MLPIDDHDLARCVACGLCLPACPTWRVTGLERASPRGRIAAMRAVQWDGAPVDAEFAAMMDECVECRGCEPVCPAFVPFGHLMEAARAGLRAERVAGRRRGMVRRTGEWFGYRVVLPRHRLLMALTWLAWLAQRLRVVPRRLGLPLLLARSLRRPLARSLVGRGEASGADAVYLFPGCVMDAWMREDHRAAIHVIEAAGGQVRLPGRGSDCCGALHLHAGRIGEAARLLERVIGSMPGDAPVLVDSAGCGAVLKDAGRVVGTAEARSFATRVVDVHEWLMGREIRGLSLTGASVVVQDPCHLRHVQNADAAVRATLSKAFEVVEVDDGGLCCGAGGAYALLEPALAGRIRDRKVEAVARAGADRGDYRVASANPGCVMHLRAGGVDARHSMSLLADAIAPPLATTEDR